MRMFDVQGIEIWHRVANYLSFCAIPRICRAGRMPSCQRGTAALVSRLPPEPWMST